MSRKSSSDPLLGTTPSVLVGAAGNILAAVRNGDGFSLILADGGAMRLFVRFTNVDGDPNRGGPVADLVVERDGRISVVASGGMLEMAALKEQLAAQLSQRLGAASSGPSRPLFTVVVAAAMATLGLTAGVLIGKAPHLTTVPGTVAGAPGTGPIPVMPSTGNALPQLPDALRQALSQGGVSGGFSKVDRPVPLPAVPAKPEAKTPEAAPAAPAAPVSKAATAEASKAAPGQPETPKVEAPRTEAPKDGADKTAEAAAPVDLPPANPAASTAAAEPSTEPSMAAIASDAEGAQKLLGTLRDLRERASRGEQVTPEMLASLPKDIGDKLRETGILDKGKAASSGPRKPGTVERIDPRAYARAKTDSFGIPDIPPASSWVVTGGNVVLPLPGGGDIKRAEDLAVFGLEP